MIDGFKSWHMKTSLEVDELNYKGLRIHRNHLGGHGIRGSLHGTKNNGVHNADDYTMSDFQNTIHKLHIDIGLNADITPVNGFEFGVNVNLATNPNNVLKRLILHKSNTGTCTMKNYKEFEYNNQLFKFYNKSEQTNIDKYKHNNILRIEVKVKKMIYIRKKGVHCIVLSDLNDIYTWQRLEQILIETLRDCLFIDFTTAEVNSLSNKDRTKYLEYINPMFWDDLHEGNRNKYSRERKKCEIFISKYSKSTLKNDIINLVSEKCAELRDIQS